MSFHEFDVNDPKFEELLQEFVAIAPGAKCEIAKYLPGIVCERPATCVWGYGSIIDVCDFHAQLEPEATEDELLTQLFDLERAR
jgi:hypothetical protein